MIKYERNLSLQLHRIGEPSSVPFKVNADVEGVEKEGQLFAMITLEYNNVFERKHSENFCFQFDGDKPFGDLDFPVKMSVFPTEDMLELLETESAKDAEGDGQ